MALSELSRLSFRPITLNDLVMIHQWSQRPHVVQWWKSQTSIEEMEAFYVPSIIGASTTSAYVALRDNESIGFIQSYVVMGSGCGWWNDEKDPGARGIDQYLAQSVAEDQRQLLK